MFTSKKWTNGLYSLYPENDNDTEKVDTLQRSAQGHTDNKFQASFVDSRGSQEISHMW